jgi:predicted RNA-binding Zn-ribbon protein involved in translation (DUF1610 family)
MFKSAEQVTTFIDLLEKFVGCAIDNRVFKTPGDAANLNKMRGGLEAFVMVACGITTASDTTDTLVCPDCGSDMALRTNRQNGNKFWGCKKYPNCRGTRDENGLSKAEREEQKYKQDQVSQEGGFSFNRDKRSPATEVAPPTEPIPTWVNPFAKK